VEEDKVDLAKSILAHAGDKLMLPLDHVVAAEFAENAPNKVVEVIPDGEMGMDIGPKTRAAYAEVLKTARTIIWNGPMGVFEKKPFDAGTVAVAKAVADSGALSVVGGGDSEKAVKNAGVADKISHISTGGGATLEYLSGIPLRGVAALMDKQAARDRRSAPARHGEHAHLGRGGEKPVNGRNEDACAALGAGDLFDQNHEQHEVPDFKDLDLAEDVEQQLVAGHEHRRPDGPNQVHHAVDRVGSAQADDDVGQDAGRHQHELGEHQAGEEHHELALGGKHSGQAGE